MRAKRSYLYTIGALFAIGVIYLFSLEASDTFKAPGKMNTGHEKLACIECHQEAKGTVRQQIQSQFRYLIGAQKHAAAFGYLTPDNDDCLACHDFDDDKHPVYRFNEPKYQEVRKKIAPHKCISCHREHHGKRVTIEVDFCKHCHSELTIEDDPIDPTHETLVKKEEWRSCLRCHDFHETTTLKHQATIKK